MKKKIDQLEKELSQQLPVSFYRNENEHTYTTQAEFSVQRHERRIENNQHSYLITYADHHKSFQQEIDIGHLEGAGILDRVHTNDFYEMLIAKQGSIDVLIEGMTYTIPEGGCCLFNYNSRHSESSSGDYVLDFIWFSPGYLQKNDRDLNLFTDRSHSHIFTPFFTADLYGNTAKHKDFVLFYPRQGAESATAVDTLLAALIKELQDRRAGYKLISRGYLKRIISILEDSRLYEVKYVNLQDDKDLNLFRNVRLYINSKSHRVTGQELAETFHYNYEYIARVFKKHSGKTITEYSHHHVMTMAARLLRETDLSVAEITDRAGFFNRTHFNRLFKEQFGLSPRLYREKN